ncbi:helix-turn-helix transcriptional regulator [Paenibacillus soyae]|uniref:AraC family transcriptional regulator n=1 Tax=Paenibacillus soyae TaxID=2969249 RepID=A0A9X2MV17_9BACL|nr:AraC family transcriptional regulator [Paenibacillus soyae]MCR2806804.1 AraC family transcriptional regulator [Paenibacillus soyae]
MELEDHHHLVPNVFLFVERVCYPGWNIQKSKISFHDLTFVVEGKAQYVVNGVKYNVEAGDLIYVPGGSIREAHTCKKTPMHAYPFNFFWAEPHNHIQLPFDVITKKVITKEILGYIREFNQVWMNKEPFYMIQARALFELILHRLLSNNRRQTMALVDLRIKKLTAFLSDHYSDDITMNELARQFNLHPVYLGKLFKLNTGSTFKEYLNRIRINNAERLLSGSGLTVREVAERCGFEDLSYFSKVFKELKGYPPSIIKKC